MPSNYNKLVRARMKETGESRQTAARHVREMARRKAKTDPFDCLRFLDPEILRAEIAARGNPVSIIWIGVKLDLSGAAPEDLVCAFARPFVAPTREFACAIHPDLEIIGPFYDAMTAWTWLGEWHRDASRRYEERAIKLLFQDAA